MTGAMRPKRSRSRVGILAFHYFLIAVLTAGCFGSSCDKPTGPHLDIDEFRIEFEPTVGPTGYAGLQLSAPMVVRVYHYRCQGGPSTCTQLVPGIPVSIRWSVSTGGGTVNRNVTQQLDANGRANVLWTLGAVPGTATLTAMAEWALTTTLDNNPPITTRIDATVVAAHPILSIVSGGQQTASPNATLSQPLVVQLTNNTLAGARAPLANIPVFWATTSGTVTPQSSTTDAQGMASATWKIGAGLGTQNLTASVLGNPFADPASVFTVNFTASAQLAPARVLRIVSGDQQRSIVGRAQLQPIVVEYVSVTPSTGVATPIAGAAITFTPVTGSAVPLIAVTNAQGRASTNWTLGPVPGAQTLQVATPVVTGFDPASLFAISVGAIGELPDVRFQDDFTTGLQWLSTVIQNDQNAWTQSSVNSATGGNPGGFRRMLHTLTVNTAPTFSTIFVQHLYTGGTYEPSTQGAVTAIDYAEDHQIQGSVYGSFVIVQGGVTYQALFPAGSVFAAGPWQTTTLAGLKPTDFTPAPGPNFSGTGSRMQFGFIRGNTARFLPLTNTHDIDNWVVVVKR